jgi:tetratricopeptide (TPR) repeat protein
MALSFLVTAAFLLPAAQNGLPNPHLFPSEQALYAGNFNKARALIDAGLKSQTDPAARFGLLLQRVRVQQIARLSGLPDSTETAALATLKAHAVTMPKDLQAQARHVELVSTYFRRLTGVESGDFISLQSEFHAVAQQLADPCRKADALFFSALMPQMQGKVLDSAAGLEQARSMAAAAGCDLELSYALRHLAVVAEEQGDLDKAASLAADSLAIRRRLGFEVYLPYSLLLSADLAQKRGDSTAAKALRKEAVQVAERLKLPEQAKAARAALAEPKLAGNGDR